MQDQIRKNESAKVCLKTKSMKALTEPTLINTAGLSMITAHGLEPPLWIPICMNEPLLGVNRGPPESPYSKKKE